MPGDVLLAAVMGAQGLRGEVKVKTFTQAPDALSRYGVLHARDGRVFTITAFRSVKPGEAVIAFGEVRDRNAAEALRGTELFVARDALPPPGEDEFYHADLVGLEARDTDGRSIGKVAALHNFGAGDVIEIAQAGGDSVMLVFSRETVPVIDVAGGFVIVAIPEDAEDSDHVA